MGLWTTSVLIFNAMCTHGQQSVRGLAERIGLSKSSVHRHLQAINRRDCSPESSWWETEAGRHWLLRLVVATLFVFGLTRGVGAETRSEFCSHLHLEAHVGCSPNALRRGMHTLECLMLDTAAEWEQAGMAHGELRPVIGAVDETFFQRMMLVFMDLASGYLLMEKVAIDRSYDTWYEGSNARLKTFGIGVSDLGRDRAKALIKGAHTGLGCLRIPDVLHLSHALAKGYSLSFFSRLRQAQQALAHARQRLEALQVSPPERAQGQQAQVAVEHCEAVVQRWQRGRSAYRQHRANLSRILHLWRLGDATRQTSQEVERQLPVEIQALEILLDTHGVPVHQGTLDKGRTQLGGVSALIDFWGQTVWHDVEHMAMPPRWTQWGEELLLPLMYWQEQLSRTRCAEHKAQIVRALQAVQAVLEQHPCTRRLTPEVLASWHAWAGEHARAFQRASSAVEGRNGYLAQMQHNHRGLPTRRDQIWTVRHNVDGRASDGTTPAVRFFRREFPALFESVLLQIDALPLPRQRHQVLTVSD